MCTNIKALLRDIEDNVGYLCQYFDKGFELLMTTGQRRLK